MSTDAPAADTGDAVSSSTKLKFTRALQAIRDETKKTRDKLETLADVVQALAAFDRDGHIKMQFDDDDDRYDIETMQNQSQDRVEYADKLLHTESEREEPVHDVPKMNVCIMIVGTRGDVQPFIGIAKRLQQDGHRVRLATHAVYRDFVTEYGVEFYPLGGDPKELAAYMVKTGGHLIPVKLETIQKDVPRNLQMIEEILHSTWPAVSEPDPEAGGPGVPGEPFRAQAIISNPVTYGHIHVAERLGVPLHIMFPQPWVPTTAFPHPLSNLEYNNKSSKMNYLSYKLVDLLMWQGTEGIVNEFRTEVLGLLKIRKGDGGRDMLLDLAIPHAFMWSPALVPKPTDWGKIYDVIGTVTLKEAGPKYTPTPELEAFLGNDGGPIFVGFGSMVIEDPKKTTSMITEAAKLANNARVLIQSSWSDMAAGLDMTENIMFLGNCPHDWLMPRVSAVVHHGGAGTTAAGLLAGKPTFIIPFFGDQPFWGRAVMTAGVGVEPCPIAELTVEKLRVAFEGLQSPELRENAMRIREVMNSEDGVEGAVDSFYRNLPLSGMRCDLGCKRIAAKWSQKDKLKLCVQCEFVITSRQENSSTDIVDYHAVDYTARGPDSALEGAAAGMGAFVHELGSGVKDILIKPAQGYRDEGAKGAVIGLMKGIGGIFIRPVQGAALFADHIATGHYNGSRGSEDRKKGTVFMENKLFRNAIGSSKVPEAHTAVMNPDEHVEVNRKSSDRQQVAIHLSSEEKLKFEAKFNEIMAKRSADTEANDLVVAKSRSAKENAAPVLAAHLVVSSAEFNDQGGIDIRFRNGSAVDKLLGEAELHSLEELSHVETTAQENLYASVQGKKVPPMNICMMTTGSWGESVQQYVAIGLRLKRDGHRVRIATNSGFRDRIIAAGLEFYPLGGRATTTGKLLQYLYEKNLNECKKKSFFDHFRMQEAFPEVQDLKDLMSSLWPACVEVDPLAPGNLFRADAIISHPFMFGQTAVAERLGVPLHCMSYNPLSRTQAFPHLMSASLTLSKPYRYAPTNSISYDVIGNTMWTGMKDLLDEFRASMGLSGKSVGANLLAEWRVPHSYLWNLELLPKPLDWGREINITGYVELEQEHVQEDEGQAAALQKVESFVSSEPSMPAIYFGFARAEWDPRHIRDLLQKLETTARKVNVRVIFQTCEENNEFPLHATDTVLEVNQALPAKHILKHVNAALHWGDLSITSAVLAAGKPACVIARNITQRLWGQALVNAGVGVEHLETDMLSVGNIGNVFCALLSETLAANAKQLAQTFSPSDAVENAVTAFYANLPLTAMTCDLDPTRLARIYDPVNQLKLSYEAHVVVRQLNPADASNDLKYKPMQYSLHHPPRLSMRGLKDDVAAARGLIGGFDAQQRLPLYTYDVIDTSAPATSSNPILSAAPVAKLRGKLNRYQSMAINVIETPAFWSSEAEEHTETAKIHETYEKILLDREKPFLHH
ncbi:Sterol 3-beta-glucosyltransferase, partial [Globisporangium splendens]